MSFTVVFNTISKNRSYLLTFKPAPVWVIGTDKEIVVTRSSPEYQKGGVKKLLNSFNYNPERDGNKCVIIVHADGYGTEKDLNTLIDDLTNEGFEHEVFQWESNDNKIPKYD